MKHLTSFLSVGFEKELPYGDQGLFMTRRVFDKVGGFPEYRLMEDYAMVNIYFLFICSLQKQLVMSVIKCIQPTGHIKRSIYHHCVALGHRVLMT